MRKQFKRFISTFGPRQLLVRAVQPVVTELLEQRRLYAVTASIPSSQLEVTGTSGADTIKIYQDSSTNTVTVYDGANVVSGSPFSIFNFTSILVNAGGGNDTVTIGSTAHGTGSDVNVKFDVPVSAPAEMHGEAGNDTLYGTDQADTIEGEAGGDTLYGAAGNDTLRGEEDNDTLNGESANDTMLAMSGTDGADVFNGGTGTDTVDYSARTSSSPLTLSIDNLANDGTSGETDNVKTDVEKLIGGQGDDTINGSGNDDVLDGQGGNDVMYGGFGNDDLTGGGGTDIMYGNEGNDTFRAGDSTADSLFGGSGSDTATDRDTGTPSDFVMDIEIL